MNAAETFVDANVRAGRGDSVAIVDAAADREITYRDVLGQVDRTGHALRRLGIRPEERVMVLLPDVPEFAYAFFGAIKIGAVAVPVNTLLKPHDYEYLLNDSRARTLIVHASLLPLVDPVRSSLRHLQHVLVAGDAAAGTSFGAALAGENETLTAEPMSD